MDAEKHYYERLQSFAAEEVERGGIALVGSSHLELFDAARLLPGRRFVNRGICGDRIGIEERGILHRLEVSALDFSPSYVFLENGANDLGELWRHGRPSIPEIAGCYEQVVVRIRQRLPNVPLCVISVLPTTGEYAGMSPLVPELNEHLQRIAGQHGCPYMDFFSDVVGEHGVLRGELTEDGLHLNAQGYSLWAKRFAAQLDTT